MDETPEQMIPRLRELAEDLLAAGRREDAAAARTGAGALAALVTMGVRTRSDFVRLLRDGRPAE